jgi:hypothetical protein
MRSQDDTPRFQPRAAMGLVLRPHRILHLRIMSLMLILVLLGFSIWGKTLRRRRPCRMYLAYMTLDAAGACLNANFRRTLLQHTAWTIKIAKVRRLFLRAISWPSNSRQS